MIDIYELKELSEHIRNEFECFTYFSFMGDDFIIEIKTQNGKKYGFSFNVMSGDWTDMKQWLENIPNQFRNTLVKEVLNDVTW